jgi:AMMECR1 domain-containing protein
MDECHEIVRITSGRHGLGPVVDGRREEFHATLYPNTKTEAQIDNVDILYCLKDLQRTMKHSIYKTFIGR